MPAKTIGRGRDLQNLVSAFEEQHGVWARLLGIEESSCASSGPHMPAGNHGMEQYRHNVFLGHFWKQHLIELALNAQGRSQLAALCEGRQCVEESLERG
jgi:hypothetical protein